jgi:serine/threonine-protein kinase
LDREKQLSIDSALNITAGAANALEYAHRRGVIHRDVKPENILLHEGFAMVADFGIALAVRAAGGERLTETGLSLGTPAYMSPEQVAGDRDIDARSDIYSLACVLYEMLAGDPPFVASNPQAVLFRHITDPPPPITTVRSSVPPPVAAAIRTALGKAPADRFQTATKFAEALFSGPGGVEEEARAIAVLPFANLSPDPDDEFLSDGIAEEIINALANVQGLRVIARTSSFAFKGRNEDVRTIGSQLGVGRVLEGSVRRAGSRLRITAQLIDAEEGEHVWSERYDRGSEDIFEIQDEIADSIVRKLREDRPVSVRELPRGGTESKEAHELYLRGRYYVNKMTDRWCAEAIACFEKAIEIDGTYPQAFAGIAEAWVMRCLGIGILVPRDAMQNAKEAARRALQIDPASAEGYTWLALAAMHYDWEWGEASRMFQKAIELNPNLAAAHSWYAWFLTWIEAKYDLALEHYTLAEKLDPLALDNRYLRGYTHYAAGDYDRALDTFEQALELEPGFAQVHYGMGDVYNQQGRLDEAIVEFRQAVEFGGRATNAVALLSYVYGLAGQPEKARALIAELEQRSAEGYSADVWIAVGYAGLGETNTMFEWLEKGYRNHDPVMAYLSRTHEFDTYRSDPRFGSLLERLGLAHFNV